MCVNETPFGNVEIKQKVDQMYELANEILALTGDYGEYTDDENEVLDEVANVVNTYKNTFGV